ncbi:MAG: METTL5 family protein [Candidatus Thermoplasmatota archaeon]
MKKKQLEMELQKIPDFDKPKPSLEQYVTPAPIAADIIFKAVQFGDIQNKIVIDLGCGTGIFAYGAYLCGAEKVMGIDIDKECINQARNYAYRNKIDINFNINRIKNVNAVCDTVLMNPPFGAQKGNIRADRKFLEKAREISSVTYSLHLTETLSFIEKLIELLDGDITFKKNYDFPIKRSFRFHKKDVSYQDVILIRTSFK